ncbi:Na+/H+ antiporter NhaC family protein [Bacillus testis]|uniref:Na+/H+ antiporter NhaC family protein n=1 Tax=Bacillus testis TaxID=1622072 RepID=UPI00067EA1D6|nr:Na+/H+ antiporter NhaC family protein [Bacillus testis]
MDSIISIIPPIVIITLVIMTRKIVLSLGAGILLSAILIEQGHLLKSIENVLLAVIHVFYSDGTWNNGNLYVLSFLLLLGILTAVISTLGGNRAFGMWIGKKIHTKRGAQLMTATCGISLFPDDVFNMFVTSQVAGPVIDHAKVPRTKLAYIIHSTSDPTCVLCPLSSWGAYIIAILTTIFASLQLGENPLMAFMIIATTNFYAISTLLFVFSSAAFDINIGRMKQQTKQLPTDHIKSNPNGSIWELVIPIALLAGGAISSMIVTGYRNSETPSIVSIFANSEVSFSLVTGAVIAVLASFAFYARQLKKQQQNIKQLPSTLKKGMKTTLPAVEILLYAWVLSDFIGQLGTGNFLAGLMEEITLPTAFLPFLLFLLTGAMAFATGTSWGTFAVMLPIAAQIAQASDPGMMFYMMSAVLSGSLFGDHCSPVSDTTTVASAAAGCTQIEHVATQLPYALICAGITACSFLLLGLTQLKSIPYVFIVVIISCLIFYFRNRKKPIEETTANIA